MGHHREKLHAGKIAGSDVLTIPAARQTLLGRRVSDLITPGTAVLEDGRVAGTLHYVSAYTAFSGEPSQQEGNYFPLVFGRTGETFSYAYNGEEDTTKPYPADDDTLVLRLRSASDKVELKIDGTHLVTLDFSTARVEEKGGE